MLLAERIAGRFGDREMERVLKKIALNGALTALALGVIGMLLTPIASVWLAVPAPTPVGSTAAPPSSNPLDGAIRYRLPLTMAAWGFAFVAVSELLVYAVRGEKKLAVPPRPPQDDTAEKLLEELLGQADVALQKEKEEREKKLAAEDASHSASILTPDP